MNKQQFGGQRLGSGASVYQNDVNFGRSTFNRNKVVRTTMSPGTLVPLYTEIGLTGDTIDIDLESIVKTLPTIGPLFGSFKFQVDAFQAPMRLFNNLMHMNRNDIGLRMSIYENTYWRQNSLFFFDSVVQNPFGIVGFQSFQHGCKFYLVVSL